MVKVLQPLLSVEASGSIAHFLTFSNRNSGQQCRWQKKQKDVITDLRTIQRADFLNASLSARYFECGVAYCGITICGFDILDLNLSAIGKALSGYNLAIKEFLNNYI
jgi:hypothetical protein